MRFLLAFVICFVFLACDQAQAQDCPQAPFVRFQESAQPQADLASTTVFMLSPDLQLSPDLPTLEAIEQLFPELPTLEAIERASVYSQSYAAASPSGGGDPRCEPFNRPVLPVGQYQVLSVAVDEGGLVSAVSNALLFEQVDVAPEPPGLLEALLSILEQEMQQTAFLRRIAEAVDPPR